MDGNTSERSKKESNEEQSKYHGIHENQLSGRLLHASKCHFTAISSQKIRDGQSWWAPTDPYVKANRNLKTQNRYLETVSSLGLKIADTSLDYASKQTHNHAWIHALIICSELNSDMLPLLIKVGLKEVEIWKTQYRYNNSINSSSAEATKSLRNIVKDAN